MNGSPSAAGPMPCTLRNLAADSVGLPDALAAAGSGSR
jgi:hypothetical protein